MYSTVILDGLLYKKQSILIKYFLPRLLFNGHLFKVHLLNAYSLWTILSKQEKQRY